jgi:uncharacterized protein GlcG (DUF336 family)
MGFPPRLSDRGSPFGESFTKSGAVTEIEVVVLRIRLIRIIGVRIIWIVRIRVIGIGESEPAGESEPDEDRIRPEKTVIGEKAMINEKTIIREKVAVKIIESAVEKSTRPSEARTLKLVESATVKTHTTAMETSHPTAMETATAKTATTCADRRQREQACEYSGQEKLQFHICSFLPPPLWCVGRSKQQLLRKR